MIMLRINKSEKMGDGGGGVDKLWTRTQYEDMEMRRAPASTSTKTMLYNCSGRRTQKL